MKKGDLVRWAHPLDPDIGVVVTVIPPDHGARDASAVIRWIGDDCTGQYPVSHHLLKTLREGDEEQV